MFCNNGIYRDVTLPVDGWCVMTCQHVHNGGYCMLALLFELMILMFWWLSYYCSKDLLSEFVYMLAGHNTSTVNR
jgi:hypothetical protein